jgi:hypothetical protein
MSAHPEGLVAHLRDELGLAAVLDDDECPGCRVVIADVDGLQHIWHEPHCAMMAHPSQTVSEEEPTAPERGPRTATWERGSRIGHVYASRYKDSILDDEYTARGVLTLRILAAGLIPEDLRSRIAAFLVDPDDVGEVSQFWNGFAAGVTAYLVEEEMTALTEADNG